MSFLDDIADVGKSAMDFIGGNNIGSQLARTALLGFALNQLSNSVNKENDTNTGTTNTGSRVQVNPDPDASLPVVYGNAWLGGIVTDAVLTNNNGTMYYCLAICEKTGVLDVGRGAASTFTFGEIYWDDMRLVFEDDGITVKTGVDREGNLCDKVGGNIKIYCYAGNSEMPTVPNLYKNHALFPAYNIFPNWTSDNIMSDTIFVIIRVDYDATKDVKGLGNVRFEITNSMSLPGDCLYDYMTNTRYGAGIPAGEIYSA